MSVFSGSAQFTTTQKQRTIICGSTPVGSPVSVSISDATIALTDPDTGVTEVLGTPTWWKLQSVGASNGTVYAVLAFQESPELLSFLCDTKQVAQVHLLSSESFTVDAKFG